MTEPGQRWPRSVYGGGQEPDPRFSLANERTFLAWIRTALALLAGAAAIRALDMDLSPVVERAASAILAGTALICAAQAWRGWATTERALRHGRPLPSNSVGLVVAVIIVAASIAMIVVGVSDG